MRLVSTAKVGGSIHLLWPALTSVEDLPLDLSISIDQSLKILSWHEGTLAEDEIPPRWMWPLDWELEDWFKDLKLRRGGSDDEMDHYEEETRDDNEFAARFKQYKGR